jgi:hypothetical protein
MRNASSAPHVWSGCDLSVLDGGAANASSSGGDAVAARITLEATCSPLKWSRVAFFLSFLLNSCCLLFSFVRHHVKYGRNPCCEGIETERHKVVIGLAVGSFARALCFIVDPEFWPAAADGADGAEASNLSVVVPHICLRVLKDVLFVYAFSLVVLFWNKVLRALQVYGTNAAGQRRRWRDEGWCACYHSVLRAATQWIQPEFLHTVLVAFFAVVRTGVAIARIAHHGRKEENEVWGYTLYGILVFMYGVLIFPVAMLYGLRLQSRLRAVGQVVRRNLLRLRAFMFFEFLFSMCLAAATTLRLVLFSMSGWSEVEEFDWYFTLKVLVKAFEVGMVTTLSLLMIARTKRGDPHASEEQVRSSMDGGGGESDGGGGGASDIHDVLKADDDRASQASVNSTPGNALHASSSRRASLLLQDHLRLPSTASAGSAQSSLSSASKKYVGHGSMGSVDSSHDDALFDRRSFLSMDNATAANDNTPNRQLLGGGVEQQQPASKSLPLSLLR